MADDSTPNSEAGRDYRDTVFLPQTPFPMRAGLPQKEPEILARWAQADIYRAMRKARADAGAPIYVLHDGPPYANGAIHIGHALNKILKDFVVRSRFALGYDVDYVPGWDCHGLPIEWKIEEEFRSKGRRKDEVSKAEFREACRAYADKWIDAQRTEFKRLGVLGAWDQRYATMDFGSEAAIVAEFHKFLMSGQLYRGSKPVMWSPVERTALADAEVEYHDHVSPTVWVKFPVRSGPEALRGAAVVIWTTTPWTLPANRAISYGPDIAYGLYEVTTLKAGLEFEPWARVGEKVVLADVLAEGVFAAANVEGWTRLQTVLAADLAETVCAHPLATLDAGYGFAVPMLAGEHVTEDAGTGFVHTAPGHGADDYLIWLKHGHRDIPETVDPDGAYYPHVPLFGGLKVMETEGKKAGRFGEANKAVMDKLIEAGNLLARGRLEHSYPHSWRSKAPVIFRNTPQWFIRMDEAVEGGKTLRQTALKAIDDTAFYPKAGQTRIRSMVEGRPDWLISRQRAWGTPLAMFVDKNTGEPLKDPEVNSRILAAIAAEGADAWFTRPVSDFLGDRNPDDYEKVEDILDVWFDSGSTHAFCLEPRNDTRWPADLYLEGSDQARGWFQSSLLESCGTRGRAPYQGVLTHGFVLDEHGEKMSKSKGNTTEPQAVTKESGAEILRLWVAMSDYAEDLRIGKTILQTAIDSYRKLRNTVRYLLGALDGFSDAERVGYEAMPPLERYVLHRLWQLDAQVRAAYEQHRYDEVWRPVADFCAQELSALYFDVRKDSLYCDAPEADRRRAARTVMDLVFERLTVWLSPIAPFTMEEAWTTRFPDAGSNLLRVFPETPDAWRNDAEAERWGRIGKVLEVVTGALEVERREKRIGSALEAAPRVSVADAALAEAFAGVDPAEVFRSSQAAVSIGESEADAFRLPEVDGVAVRPFRAEGAKCARCWRILPEVTDDLCNRCEAAVS
jgi:isoleucyl-tRNA synthetase